MRKVLAIAAIATTGFVFASPAFGQFDFGKLLNSLQDKLQAQESQNQKAAPNAGSSKPGEQKAKGFGARATESYCRNQFSIAGIGSDEKPNESLISDEFKLEPKDFFDAALSAFAARHGYVSYTFPSPDFYRGEFETDKINVLYNLLLSYPSSQYIAILISESQKSSNEPRYDHQEKLDAIAALAMLHFRMQNYSKTPGRWKELVTSLKSAEHYTGMVLWARAQKSGEFGAINLGSSINNLVVANGLRNKYQNDAHIKTMSKRNYAVTSNQTLYEIFKGNTTHPDYKRYERFVTDYETHSTIELPEVKTQLSPGLASIEKAAASATTKASQMLSGATEAAKLKAQKASLDNAARTRVADSGPVNIDIKTMAALARQLEKADAFDEKKRKVFAEALADAHQAGDQAVAMMPAMMNAMMTVMFKRGMSALPGILPYTKKLEEFSDGACTVISRWDHVAQVQGALKMDADSNGRSALADLVAESK